LTLVLLLLLLLLLLQVEVLGANIAANGSREQMSYTIDCLRSHVPAALELLCDCVINPAFKSEELEEQKMRLQLLLSSPDVQLTILTEVSWYMSDQRLGLWPLQTKSPPHNATAAAVQPGRDRVEPGVSRSCMRVLGGWRVRVINTLCFKCASWLTNC
jgi:hypothetical protein